MKITADKSHAYCPTEGCHVSLDQTEGQCRDAHHCGDGACPLEKEFSRTPLSKALEMMAAGLGQVAGKLG